MSQEIFVLIAYNDYRKEVGLDIIEVFESQDLAMKYLEEKKKQFCETFVSDDYTADDITANEYMKKESEYVNGPLDALIDIALPINSYHRIALVKKIVQKN